MNKNAASATARAAGEKAKKQKKILAVTSVIFLALLGFQLPKLMHSGGGGGGEAAAPPADTSITPATPIAVPSSSSLPDTDRVTLTPGSGQLVSFGLFKSKDPFVQQLGTTPAVDGVTPAPDVNTPQTLPAVTSPAVTTQPVTTPRRTAPNGGLTPVTTTTPTTTSAVPAIPGVNVPTTPASPSTTPISTTPVSLTPGTTTTTATKPAPAPTSASISTNGLCEVIAVNGTFPSQDDIFRVVSIAKDGKSAKIGIVGGAYDSGASAITLELGKKLTLVNTADGSRYVLILKAKCDTQTTPVTGGATTTTPTSTVAPPATTSTATTPIVTDALDTTTPTP